MISLKNTLFVDAIKKMRKEANSNKCADMKKIVDEHEWFLEMREKLLFNVRKNITKTEKRMMMFIQA